MTMTIFLFRMRWCGLQCMYGKLVFVQNSANLSRASFDFDSHRHKPTAMDPPVVTRVECDSVCMCVATWQAGAWEEAYSEAGEEVHHGTDGEELRVDEGTRSTQRRSQWAQTHSRHQRSDILLFLIHVSTLLFVGIFTTCKCSMVMFAAHISVCLSVCLCVSQSVCCALTFESLELESTFLVCRYIFRISRSDRYIEVIGSRSTPQKPKACLCIRFVGDLPSTERQSCFPLVCVIVSIFQIWKQY